MLLANLLQATRHQSDLRASRARRPNQLIAESATRVKPDHKIAKVYIELLLQGVDLDKRRVTATRTKVRCCDPLRVALQSHRSFLPKNRRHSSQVATPRTDVHNPASLRR
jgi:hypothetical protein